MSTAPIETDRQQAQKVTRILFLEGLVNFGVLLAKLWVGLSTGALSVMSDALHSGSDLGNNAFAMIVARLSHEPPDAQHPYGHRKFETLAVFVLGMLLTALSLELGRHALFGGAEPPSTDPLSLSVMLGVLAVNIGLSAWQHYWAHRLGSALLRADARHTLSDVLTTVAVIGGWQLSTFGFAWADRATAGLVALLVLYLALDLFRATVPTLVDAAVVDAAEVVRIGSAVPGVRRARHVRSRSIGGRAVVDLVIEVDPNLTTRDAHAIADAVERAVEQSLSVYETSVHVEPMLREPDPRSHP